MKQAGDVSVWSLALLASASVTSLACSDDPLNGGMGPGGGSAGSNMTAGGTDSSAGGTSAGTPPTSAGTSAGTGGTASAGSSSGGSAGSASGGSSAGTGGSAEAGGSGGSGGLGGSGPVGMPYGIVSCQPAFETACKPNIVFENQDPNGRGKFFNDAVPDAVNTMKDIACTACSILYRDPSEIPQGKHPSTIKLVLDTHGGVAQAGGSQIQFDLNYINKFGNEHDAAETKQEMLGVLQHETVHLYQNYGNNGTGEGLADLVRARTGYYPKSRWQSEGTWKSAYTASGNFYSWLTGPCTFHSESYPQHDFDLPYKLNKVLAGKEDDAAYDVVAALLQTTFGKDVDQLWDEYQADAYGR